MSNLQTAKRLFAALHARRKRHAAATLILMIFGGFAEVVSIGAVLPLLTLISDPEGAAQTGLAARMLAILPAGSGVTAALVIFAGIFVIAALVRLVLTWVSNSFAFGAAHDLSVTGYNALLRQPYTFYKSSNSSVALAAFEKIYLIAYSVLVAGAQGLSASIVAAMLLLFLLTFSAKLMVLTMLIFGTSYLAVTVGFRRLLSSNSEILASATAKRSQYIQEGLGSIRDLIIDRSQAVLVDEFSDNSDAVRRALSMNAFAINSPRIFVETIGIIFLGCLAYWLSVQGGGLAAAIPTIGVFALAAQRLLPQLQQAYVGWGQFSGNRQNVIDVVEMVTMPVDPLPPKMAHARPFDELRLEDVRFSYGHVDVLDGINLAVAKGDRVGIVGESGSGKSTLVDLILGLLPPSSGRMTVNGAELRSSHLAWWHSEVAHVPQSIHIADTTLGSNIAFGVPACAINRGRALECAERAGLLELVHSLPLGLETTCGEGGARLSGGQRQRVGIARALYKGGTFLVLDEATSSLDKATEESVMATIDELDAEMTIIIIAHRTSTLRGCNRIISLSQGRIVREVSSAAEL